MKYSIIKSPRINAVKIAGVYIFISALWIYFSDNILRLLYNTASVVVDISIYKGLTFIIITGALLYFLVIKFLSKIKQNEQNFSVAFHSSPSLIIISSINNNQFVEVNKSFENQIGYTREEIIGCNVDGLNLLENPEEWNELKNLLLSEKKYRDKETKIKTKSGEHLFVLASAELIDFAGKKCIMIVAEDITERKNAEDKLKATVELLRICNKSENLTELIKSLTVYFQQYTSCTSIGVRLRKGNDFPYYETIGFSEEFILAENNLCAKDQKNELIRDYIGHPALDCMCGNILCKRFDPSKPFFSQRGSFWSGCTSELLANTTEADRQSKTRNRCNGEGYESVALIPLRVKDETFGLFQFNDKRKGLFTEKKISFYEDLIDYVAIAVANLKKDDEIQESNRFNQQIINSANEGIIVYDNNLNYTVWNPYMERLTGLTSDKVIGKHPLTLFPFIKETPLLKNLYLALDGKTLETLTFQFYLIHNQKKGWVTDTSAPLLNNDGKIIGIISVVRDITSEKFAKDALYNSEKKYHSLFENMLEGFALCKMIYDYNNNPVDFIYLDTNNSFSKLTGLKDVIGKKVTDIIPQIKHLTPELFDIYGRVSTTGNPEKFEIDFKPLSIWLSISVYSPEKGYFIAVFDNITERKQIQQELISANQRLKLATSSLNLGIWDWDIKNNVLLWDDRMYEIYGISKITSKPNFEIWKNSIITDDRETALDITKKAIESQYEYDTEFRIQLPDGNIKNIKANAIIIRDDDGTASRMIGLNQDITDLKHLEEQLRQSQKMEAIGQLAGGIAHDFNNILSIIYGNCVLMQMELENNKFKDIIDSILTASKRAANLTGSLLAFSRKQIIKPKIVNLNEIILNFTKMITRIIGEDIKLKTIFNVDPLNVFADTGQIEQVLINMSTNARDAMQNAGILIIETELKEIDKNFNHSLDDYQPGKYAVISISDTGKGIDKELQKKIFDPFFTTKEVGKGTGLGLSIVYGVIKQHKGYINVYSEPDKGTTFRIYLPITNQKKSEIEENKINDYPQMGTETILLAEDDPFVSQFIETILKKFGYKIILAQNGDDAINKFRENTDKIQFIIMDMVMPEKSGKDAYSEICNLKPDIKILFISGYSNDLLANKGLFENNYEILVKPFQPLELIKKIRKILDSVNK
ncbi:PAS domain S-box protein [Candidatus Dependentiae bacterium]|nr:PAS domain S-box protein [Candidatus Dependentiae bacterium]